MDCRETRQLAEAFVSEQLLVETTQAVVAHLERCPACRAEIDGLRRLRAAARAAVEHATDLAPRPAFAAELTARLRASDQRQPAVTSRRTWMVALAAPVLLVTGSYLGTISHTLTALTVLELARLDVRAIAVSDSVNSTVDLADTVATLERFGKGVPVVGIPRLPDAETGHPAFADLAALLD